MLLVEELLEAVSSSSDSLLGFTQTLKLTLHASECAGLSLARTCAPRHYVALHVLLIGFEDALHDGLTPMIAGSWHHT